MRCLESFVGLDVPVIRGAPFPAEEIAKAGAETDLIVLGSRGAGAWTRLMGSTATKVAHKATVPVTIVPSGQHR